MARNNPFSAPWMAIRNCVCGTGRDCHSLNMPGAVRKLFLIAALTMLIPGISFAQKPSDQADHRMENLSDQLPSDRYATRSQPTKKEPTTQGRRASSGNTVLPANRSVHVGNTGSDGSSREERIKRLSDQIENILSMIEYATAHPDQFPATDIYKMRYAVSLKQREIDMLMKPSDKRWWWKLVHYISFLSFLWHKCFRKAFIDFDTF